MKREQIIERLHAGIIQWPSLDSDCVQKRLPAVVNLSWRWGEDDGEVILFNIGAKHVIRKRDVWPERRISPHFYAMVRLWVEDNPEIAANTLIHELGVEGICYQMGEKS